VSFFITSTSGVFYGVSSTQVIPTAGWTHLAGTWDGTNLNLYINGTKNRSANPPLSAIGNSGCAFSIGGINNSCSYYGQYFPGQIDEVSLYDRALLAGEINAICVAGFAGKCKTAPLCTARPAGAVAWWPGEVDASDVLGDMHGTFQNAAACVPGFRGQGFGFNGSQQAVEIPAAPALFASSFTIEAWVKPASRVDGALGQAFIFGQSWGRQLVVRNGVMGLRVAFLICTAPWTFYEVGCSGDIPIGEWTHLIGTFDGTALKLFVNGALDQQAPLNTTLWDPACAFHIGGIYDPVGNCLCVNQFFNGLIDETTYYNQALSAADVRALYNAGNAGKCWPDPAILGQPTSQTAPVAGTATFTVVATGTAPLNYQWYRNNSAIAAATSSTLSLSSVSLFDAGSYKVVVSSVGGSVASAAATLTVSQVAAPVFSPVGGSYPSARNVVVTCTTPTVGIHYTLNGQEPAESDPTVASGSSVTVDHSLTLKAKAWRIGWTTSATESEGYRIEATPSDQPPVVTLSPPTGTTLLASDDLPILVEASDPDGTITRVQLFRDGVLVAETTASPLQCTINQAAAGTYTFTAKATDDVGFVTVSPPAVITVNGSGPVVSLAGQQPYFTSSPGTLVASVLGVDPGGLASLTLNGAAVPASSGTFTLSPALTQGANAFTLFATDKQSRTGQATATVYLDSVVPVISISAPANNSAFATTRINVLGTFTESSLKRITVNGVPAFATGTSWEALNVPLAVGANTITATAEDLAGNQGTATIAVTGNSSPVDPVQLSATPVGGFAPLQVAFQIQSSAPGTLQQVLYDFDGDGVSDQTATDLQPISHTYSAAGQYFPVVTVVATAGRFSSTGGWNGDIDRLRINVQAPPVVLSSITVADPVDLKWLPGDYLYVLSRSTATIIEFNATGTAIRTLASVGTTPNGLEVDGAGNVYIAATGDNQVKRFKPTASSFELDTTFNGTGYIGKSDRSSGSANGEFNQPFDVAVTPDGEEIAVSDAGNHRIQRFTKAGAFSNLFGQQGTGMGQFNNPKGLACDNLGLLYIVDAGNSRIVLARCSGAVLGTSGAAGSALGQFQGAVNLDIGSRGVYSAETGNNRVQAFDPLSTASPIQVNPRLALSAGLGLNQPQAVAAAAHFLEERVYIADTGNNRVILVRLPLDTPEAVWNAMNDRLLNHQDISGAVSYFASSSAEKHRQAFLLLGIANLSPIMSQVPAISPVSIESDTAQYRFDRVIQGQTITFPIEFVKENGVWRILEY
jgi:hypothetical protein